MAKQFFTNGTGAQQTLTPSQNEKVAIYDTIAEAEADLANLEAGQIVATPDTGDELAQPVDEVTDGNMHSVTSNAVANAITGNTPYNPFFNNSDFAFNIDTIGAGHRSYWSSSAGGNTTGTCPSDYGVVETIVGNDGAWKFQVAKETFSDTTYTRQNINNGGWSAWQKVTCLKEKQIRIDDTSGYSLENGVYVKTLSGFFADNGISYSKVVNIRQVNNGNNLYPYFFIAYGSEDYLKVFKFANVNNSYIDIKVYYE